MIQAIKDARTGTKFVCEIPAGWNAILLRDGNQVKVVMACADYPPVVVEQEADGVWRQREITLDASQTPQK